MAQSEDEYGSMNPNTHLYLNMYKYMCSRGRRALGGVFCGRSTKNREYGTLTDQEQELTLRVHLYSNVCALCV